MSYKNIGSIVKYIIDDKEKPDLDFQTDTKILSIAKISNVKEIFDKLDITKTNYENFLVISTKKLIDRELFEMLCELFNIKDIHRIINILLENSKDHTQGEQIIVDYLIK